MYEERRHITVPDSAESLRSPHGVGLQSFQRAATLAREARDTTIIDTLELRFLERTAACQLLGRSLDVRRVADKDLDLLDLGRGERLLRWSNQAADARMTLALTT